MAVGAPSRADGSFGAWLRPHRLLLLDCHRVGVLVYSSSSRSPAIAPCCSLALACTLDLSPSTTLFICTRHLCERAARPLRPSQRPDPALPSPQPSITSTTSRGICGAQNLLTVASGPLRPSARQAYPTARDRTTGPFPRRARANSHSFHPVRPPRPPPARWRLGERRLPPRVHSLAFAVH